MVDEKQDLSDVMIALEVVQQGVLAESRDDEVVKEGLEAGFDNISDLVVFVMAFLLVIFAMAVPLVTASRRRVGVVDKCSVDIECDLVFILVRWQRLPIVRVNALKVTIVFPRSKQ